MKLSSQTLSILKNFASINPNIVIIPGNVIRTVNEMNTLFGEATVAETFECDVPIYDLSNFLSIVGLLKDPDITFGDTSATISDGNGTIRYRYANASVVTGVKTSPKIPNADVFVHLSAEVMAKLCRAADIFKHREMSISGNDGKITASVFDSKDAGANTFSVDIDDDNACKAEFTTVMLISNMKMVTDDYDVAISKGGTATFTGVNSGIKYITAVEKNSTFHA